MHTNNIKKIHEPLTQESIIYALIFVVYIAIVVLVFVYSVKFLGKTINAALTTPGNNDITAKYGQLDLSDYALIAYKLNLALPSGGTISASDNLTASSSPEIASSSASSTNPYIATSTNNTTNISLATTTETVPATSTNVMQVTMGAGTVSQGTNTTPPASNTTSVVSTETKPKIDVINSTVKSGLAGTLKDKLQAAGFNVLKTGNSKPTEAQTIIKIKNSYLANINYIDSIKKIVAGSYDYLSQTLDEGADHDIEIIIGSK